MDGQRAEIWARDLIQAMEPSFRSRLGVRSADRDFIGELYLGVWCTLVGYDEVEVRGPGERRGIVDEIALTAYLVAASGHPGAQVNPELLESLRSEIARVVTGACTTPAAPAT